MDKAGAPSPLNDQVVEPRVDRFVFGRAPFDEQAHKRVTCHAEFHHPLNGSVMLDTNVLKRERLLDEADGFFTTPSLRIFFDDVVALVERRDRYVREKETPFARSAHAFDHDHPQR